MTTQATLSTKPRTTGNAIYVCLPDAAHILSLLQNTTAIKNKNTDMQAGTFR